jgi:hypothetical protein
VSLGEIILGLFAFEEEGSTVIQNVWGHYPMTQWHITLNLNPLKIELHVAESKTPVSFISMQYRFLIHVVVSFSGFSVIHVQVILCTLLSLPPGYNPK